MVRPIVHIGFHKTGTTWFQNAVYPRVQNMAYMARATTQAALLTPGGLHFEAGDAARQLEAAKPVILCEENLSGYLHNDGLHGFLSKEMAQRVHSVLADARIVVFVRAQPEMITACHQQYVRGGGTYGVKRYLWPQDWLYGAESQPFKVPRFSFDHFDYDRLIAHYVALFGAGNVHVYPFEAISRDARAFLARFTEDLGIELDRAALPMARQNVSYGRAILCLTRILNRFTARSVNDKRYWIHIPYWYGLRKIVVEPLNRCGILGRYTTPDKILGEQTTAWIRQRYWQSNRRLATLVAWDPAEFGYPMDPPAAPVDRPRRATWLSWTAR